MLLSKGHVRVCVFAFLHRPRLAAKGHDLRDPVRVCNRPSGKKERPTPTLMEELYQDLAQLRTRLEEVQAGIDDKTDMYATLHHR